MSDREAWACAAPQNPSKQAAKQPVLSWWCKALQTNLRDHLWVLPAFALSQTLGSASFQPLTVEAFTLIVPVEQKQAALRPARKCVYERVCECDPHQSLCVVEDGGDSKKLLNALHDQRWVGAQQSSIHNVQLQKRYMKTVPQRQRGERERD